MPKPDHSSPESYGERHSLWATPDSTPEEINGPPTRSHQAALLITALASLITALTGLAALFMQS